MTAYRLPTLFVDDHVGRDLLPASAITQWGRRISTVELTDEQRAELLDDAKHYADSANGWGPEMRSVCASASATVRRLTGGGK